MVALSLGSETSSTDEGVLELLDTSVVKILLQGKWKQLFQLEVTSELRMSPDQLLNLKAASGGGSGTLPHIDVDDTLETLIGASGGNNGNNCRFCSGGYSH